MNNSQIDVNNNLCMLVDASKEILSGGLEELECSKVITALKEIIENCSRVLEQYKEKPIQKINNENRITISASSVYDVIIGSGLIDSIGERVKSVSQAKTVVLVCGDIVDSLYGDKVFNNLISSGFRVLKFVYPHGERSKCGDVLFKLLEFMADNGVTRTDLMIALGGGVTGDLTGFASAIYLRGISYIQVPTTLLAAVDSSVGGKTAVDLNAGKNLAGAFKQPLMVLCDTQLLHTLPEEEFAAGMGEVIKCGVMADPVLFELIENSNAHDHIEEIISRCISCKRDVVMQDEYDTGLRQILNLGHTLAHAIEKKSDYQIRHGYAVAIGLIAVAKCAYNNGLTDEDFHDRIARVCVKNGLPTESDYSLRELCNVMALDKKRAGDRITLVIPQCIGKCELKKLKISELHDFYSK